MRWRTAGLWGLSLLLLLLVTVDGKAEADHRLLLTTENYPPFNMMDTDDEKIVGVSTEIVQLLMKRVEVEYDLRLYPWQRAYGLALDRPHTCVFSTTETPERLPLFKWVGPLVENSWVLFKAAGADISFRTLEEARPYVIGGYQADAVALYLEQHDFNLDLAKEDSLNPRKLASGRFDLWATGNLLGPYLAAQYGVEIEPVLTFKKTVLSLACHHSVPDHLIESLNKELKAMREAGEIEIITSRYQ